MRTTVHTYNYDVNKPEEYKAWQELQDRMMAQGIRVFRASGSYYMPALNNKLVTLETKYLFDNQWNTTPIEGLSDKGYRLFDWAEECPPNRDIKRGHWLEQTPEMIEARVNRLKCGYCGEQYNRLDNPPQFCSKCRGSEYLKSTELHLTRIAPIGFHTKRDPLSELELAEILPLYVAAQSGKGEKRDIKHGLTCVRS